VALTDAQKASIYRLLGYSDRHQDVWGGREQRIQQALGGLSAPIETEVLSVLTKLLNYETAILNQDAIAVAATVGKITLNPAQLDQLRSKASAYLGQLSALTGLQILSNPFYPSRGATGQAGGVMPSL